MKEALNILNSKETKHVLKLLEEEFGFTGNFKQYAVLQNKKDKLYLVNREIANIPLDALGIDSIGMYFGEVMGYGIRLSIEGSQLIGKDCTKNVIEIAPDEMKAWLRGHDLELEGEYHGFVLLKSGNDFLGCGKFKEGKILNYIPKARRITAED